MLKELSLKAIYQKESVMNLIETIAATSVMVMTCTGTARCCGQFADMASDIRQIRQRTSAVRFVTGSFHNICAEMPADMGNELYRDYVIGKWKSMVESMYPDVSIYVVADKDTETQAIKGMTLYWSFPDYQERFVYEKLRTT